MVNALLIGAGIILLCLIAYRLSAKLGVPSLLLFILLGMLFGTQVDFNGYEIPEKICSLGLIIVIFYGGFGTNWRMAWPVAGKAAGMASLGVLITAGLVALFSWLVLGISGLESLLLGAVVSSTDAASVFSILRAKKLNLKDNTASLLELESGSNDPFSYMLTLIFLALILGEGMSGSELGYLIFAQLAYGLIGGILIGLLAAWVLKKVDFGANGLDSIFVLVVALLSFAVPEFWEGNGYLSVYLAGIILGNSRIRNKIALVHFWDGLTGLIQILLFFLLGVLVSMEAFAAVILPAVLIALFLILVARPTAVFSVLAPLGSSWRQCLLVSAAGLRGAASIVFVMLALVGGGQAITNDLFHIVFMVALLSVAFQGTLLPFIAHKLQMVDDESDVLRTFNDYQDDTDLQLMQIIITPRHPWNNKKICDLNLSPDILIVMIKRGQETLVPKGNTVLKTQDVIVISGESYTDDGQVLLKEVLIEEGHEWENKFVRDLALPSNALIVAIKRNNGETVIPKGDTQILKGDILVLNS